MSHKHLNAIFGLRGYKRMGKKSLHVEIQQFMYFRDTPRSPLDHHKYQDNIFQQEVHFQMGF